MLTLTFHTTGTPRFCVGVAYADDAALLTAMRFISKAPMPESLDELPNFLAYLRAAAPGGAVASIDEAAPCAQATGELDHLSEAKAAVKKLLDRHEGDMRPALAVLAEFGANSLRDLQPHQSEAFVAACAAA